MNMVDIILKKKAGGELNEEEIRFFARGAADGSIPDYQLSALLMAICWQGMNAKETTCLTMEMMHSGGVVDLSAIDGVCVDKHSTGGVGDTTTLVLVPLAAACGAKVAKISGRGLGHTGGTLDKLESIPGCSVEETEERFVKQVQEIGCAVIGQTHDLCPADKALYALRDVTGTVNCIPLIASSIVSKKLASGAGAIVLDVKTGSGALMRTVEDSIALAKAMVDIGAQAGKPILALVTGMEQPLGTHVGNALEVKEAIDILAGRAGGDLLAVSLELGSRMLVAAGIARDVDDGKARMQRCAGKRRGPCETQRDDCGTGRRRGRLRRCDPPAAGKAPRARARAARRLCRGYGYDGYRLLRAGSRRGPQTEDRRHRSGGRLGDERAHRRLCEAG